MAKELVEDGVIANVEELTGIKQEENKDDAEQADLNKPGDVDLAYFEMRGKVKSFTERTDDVANTYTFTEKGKLNTFRGENVRHAFSDVARDSQNDSPNLLSVNTTVLTPKKSPMIARRDGYPNQAQW